MKVKDFLNCVALENLLDQIIIYDNDEKVLETLWADRENNYIEQMQEQEILNKDINYFVTRANTDGFFDYEIFIL